MSGAKDRPAEWKSVTVDAAKGLGVSLGGAAADAAHVAVKKAAVAKGAAVAAKGAALGAAKLSGVAALAALPGAAILLPVAAAIGAGWLARRLIARL